MTKVTKRDNFNTIIEVLNAAGREDLAAVIAHEIELLDNKAAKAKAKAAEKKTNGDALTDIVAGVLTDEYATIADITAKIDAEDVSVAKVQYRLNQLEKAGRASKTQITVGEGQSKRKVVAFALPTIED